MTVLAIIVLLVVFLGGAALSVNDSEEFKVMVVFLLVCGVVAGIMLMAFYVLVF